MVVGDEGVGNAFFLGMGFASTEVLDDDKYEPKIILPDSVDRPEPQPKREFGFNAIKEGRKSTDNQRQYFGIRT